MVFPRHTVNFSKEVFSIFIDCFKNKCVFDGQCVREFEEKFADYHKVKYACGVFSGRSGLCLALKALRFKEGEEIILSAFNYDEIPLIIKAFNLKPVFVDADPATFNIDTSQIEKHITPRTRAILVLHAFGRPCQMEPIMDIAQRNKLKVIEDCAHACGAEYKGQKAGTFGDAGIFSFAMGKNIPCFGGGMVVTQSDCLWQELKTVLKHYTYPSIGDFLKILLTHLVCYVGTHHKIFPYTAYPLLRTLDVFNITLSSYYEKSKIFSEKVLMRYQKKMMNLQAAVGLHQLEKLDSIITRLRENALLYNALFEKYGAFKIPIEMPYAKHIYLYYCFTMKNRKAFRKGLLHKGVDTEKNHLSNCPAFEMFGGSLDDYTVSKSLAEESVDLPNNVYLTPEEIRYIADCVWKVIENMRDKSGE